jgi:hypothetical protein
MLTLHKKDQRLISCRYILEEEFRQGGPFISPNDAHLSICFSCVAHLNTSYPLLPDRSTERERAALVIQGFHGLHLYANQFWMDHFLECCTSLRRQQKQLPNHLLEQIIGLFGFQKDLGTKPFDLIQAPSIEVFQQHPQLVALVKSIIWLRDKLKQDNSPNVQEMSIEGMLRMLYSKFPFRRFNISQVLLWNDVLWIPLISVQLANPTRPLLNFY